MRTDAGAALARISHAAALVPDLDQTARSLARLLGWGPWSVYEIKPPRLRERTYRDRPGEFAMLGAETHVGECDFALNQALSGPSIYDEYVERRGFGFHHLACMQNSAAGGQWLRERLAVHELAMSGSIDGEIEFAYFDTERELGTFIETGSGHAISLAPDRVIEPDPDAPGPATLDAVCVVVDDLASAVAAYERLLGWSDWEFEDRANLVEDAAIGGERIAVSGTVAATSAGPVRLELVDPGDAPSPERDALASSGPGLHHITCTLPADEREAADAAVRDLGLEVAMTATELGVPVVHLRGVVPLKLRFATA